MAEIISFKKFMDSHFFATYTCILHCRCIEEEEEEEEEKEEEEEEEKEGEKEEEGRQRKGARRMAYLKY